MSGFKPKSGGGGGRGGGGGGGGGGGSGGGKKYLPLRQFRKLNRSGAIMSDAPARGSRKRKLTKAERKAAVPTNDWEMSDLMADSAGGSVVAEDLVEERKGAAPKSKATKAKPNAKPIAADGDDEGGQPKRKKAKANAKRSAADGDADGHADGGGGDGSAEPIDALGWKPVAVPRNVFLSKDSQLSGLIGFDVRDDWPHRTHPHPSPLCRAHSELTACVLVVCAVLYRAGARRR
jgi:hypothetical protein